MMRWKPSVSSGSWPGAASTPRVFCPSASAVVSGFCRSFRAVSAIVSSRSGFCCSGSVAVEVDVLLDVLAKPQRVLADEALGKRRVASLQGLDDRHVVADRALGAVVIEDRPVPDRLDVEKEVAGHGLEQLRAAEADQRLVEGDVRRRVLVHVLAGDVTVAEALEEDPQRRDLGVARALGDEAGRHAFERRPCLDHLDDLALGLAHDEDAAARHGSDEPLLLEHRHRLANGRAGDAELLGQLALVEHDRLGRGVDVHPGDGVLQGGVSFALEARLDRDAADDEAPGLAGNPVGLAAQRPFQLGSIQKDILRWPAGRAAVGMMGITIAIHRHSGAATAIGHTVVWGSLWHTRYQNVNSPAGFAALRYGTDEKRLTQEDGLVCQIPRQRGSLNFDSRERGLPFRPIRLEPTGLERRHNSARRRSAMAEALRREVAGSLGTGRQSAVRQVLDKVKAEGRLALTAPEGKLVCDAYGIPVPKEGVANS